MQCNVRCSCTENYKTIKTPSSESKFTILRFTWTKEWKHLISLLVLFHEENKLIIKNHRCLGQIFRDWLEAVGCLSPRCSHFILSCLLCDLFYENSLMCNENKFITYVLVSSLKYCFQSVFQIWWNLKI